MGALGGGAGGREPWVVGLVGGCMGVGLVGRCMGVGLVGGCMGVGLVGAWRWGKWVGAWEVGLVLVWSIECRIYLSSEYKTSTIQLN